MQREGEGRIHRGAQEIADESPASHSNRDAGQERKHRKAELRMRRVHPERHAYRNKCNDERDAEQREGWPRYTIVNSQRRRRPEGNQNEFVETETDRGQQDRGYRAAELERRR